MIAPTCNLNGTSPNDLFDQVVGALSALRTAQKAFEDASPNGRDYPQGPGVFKLAQEAHSSRVKRLADLQRELEEIAENIADQRDVIQARKGASRP